MDYSSSLDLVLSLADFERPKKSLQQSEYHLHRIELMLQKLGNPHLRTPTVHVAGTKGKGSTAALIASVLSAQGYKTGLYTSPHLHTFRERIRTGAENISEADFAGLVAELWPLVQWVKEHGGYGEPTTFEVLTCMALLYFSQMKADFQVIEVGMGGRLDTTNVVKPEVCVLTSISLDHTEILGNTLEEIAKEKAGIIKPGSVAVAAPQPPEAMKIFRDVCLEKGVKLIAVADSMKWERDGFSLEGQSFNVKIGAAKSKRYWIPLLGRHQIENACTVLGVAGALRARGFKVSDRNIVKGFREVKWPGRLEVVKHNGKTIVVDGAHNPYSIRRMAEAVQEYFSYKELIVIFGVLGGHNLAGMAKELAILSPKALAVMSRHPRAATSDKVADALEAEGIEVAGNFADIKEALSKAMDMAGEGSLILGTGSLFVAAEIIEAAKGKEPELYPILDDSSKVINQR